MQVPSLPKRLLTLRGRTRFAFRRSKAMLFEMKVKKLNHTRYRVNDLERTVKFYEEVLGLEELHRHKSPRGSELAFLKAAESDELIEICYFPSSGPVQVQPDLTHLGFEVDSLAEFGRHLDSLGLKYSDGPTLRPGGGGFAFIDAPEGYEIELIEQPRRRNWPSAGHRTTARKPPGL
jgi:lactoylglutathione lyase